MIAGRYNPQGFTQSRIRFYLAQECGAKRLASYGEDSPDENGVVRFNATCSGGLPYGGHYIFNRLADGSILAEGTVYRDGNLSFARKTYDGKSGGSGKAAKPVPAKVAAAAPAAPAARTNCGDTPANKDTHAYAANSSGGNSNFYATGKNDPASGSRGGGC